MTTPLRVLLVEDSEDDTALLLRELRRGGYEPVYARVDSAERMAAALDREAWDVIIADYAVPDLGALPALALIQERELDLPFIVVSGAIGEESAVSMMKAGAHDCLMKDSLTRLAAAVEREVREAEVRRRHRLAEEVRARLTAIIEATSDFVSIADSDGRTLYLNGAGRRMLGFGEDEDISGLSISARHPESARAHVLGEAIPTAIRDGVWSGETVLRSQDGREIPVSQVIIAHKSSGGTVQFLSTIARDITERRRAEEKIIQHLETITALYAGAAKLTQSLDMQQLADSVARTFVETFGASLAWLARTDPDGSLHVVAHFPKERELPPGISVRWDESPQGQGLVGRAIRSGFPVIVQDIGTGRGLPPERAAVLLDHGFQSVGAFPLISREKPFGVLALHSDQLDFFTPERVEFFQAFAHQAAAALENARLFEEAHRRVEQVQALRDVDRAIGGSLDLRVTLSILLDRVTTLLQVDAAAVLILNSRTETLEHAESRGFRTAALRHTRLRLGQGYAGRAALERRTVGVVNPQEAPGEFARAPLLAEEGFVAYYAVPLVAKGQVKGVLEIFHRAVLNPGQEWVEFLETLAGQAAIAVDNAGLFSGLQRSNVDLMLAYDTTLEGWSRALDLRDKETEGHTQRVTDLTVRLARALGMSEEELIHVRRGALLHDIGKMGIPDAILHKPGPLTEEEWAIMRRHPVYAYELLSPISYLRPALDIPYCHHEKWDGTGYPRGLKGEEIPLAARIFAVPDVWDALRSDRPYRSAWPEEKARNYIREQAGKHFDPRVVEAFLRLDKQEP